jgi:hypothetical protein
VRDASGRVHMSLSNLPQLADLLGIRGIIT